MIMEFFKLLIEHPVFACGLGLFIIVLVMIVGNGIIGILQVLVGHYDENYSQQTEPRPDDEDDD